MALIAILTGVNKPAHNWGVPLGMIVRCSSASSNTVTWPSPGGRGQDTAAVKALGP